MTKKITKKQKGIITPKMKFAEIMEKHPNSAEILFENGLHCIGCGMAMQETLEDGCKAHGMNKKQIEDLIKKINGGKKVR